jgi:hypothetical protein
MSWEDIENAVQSVIAKASRLPVEQVVWSYQDVNEPTLDHLIITFGGAIAIGVDRVKTSQDLSRPNGMEIRQQVCGVREVPLELEAFTSATTGSTAARHLVETIRSRLRLDSMRAELNRAGISVFDSSPVNWIPYIPSAQFRGRATCTLRCYVPVIDAVEYVGYIARVRGTAHVTGGQRGTVDVPFDSDKG